MLNQLRMIFLFVGSCRPGLDERIAFFPVQRESNGLGRGLGDTVLVLYFAFQLKGQFRRQRSLHVSVLFAERFGAG